MMNLEKKTRELMNECKDLMDECIKQCGVDTIKDMDAASLAMIQKCLKVMDSAYELAIEQASVMDELNDKLDKVLEHLEKMERK